MVGSSSACATLRNTRLYYSLSRGLYDSSRNAAPLSELHFSSAAVYAGFYGLLHCKNHRLGAPCGGKFLL